MAGLLQPSPLDAFTEVMSAARTKLDSPSVQKASQTEKTAETAKPPDANQAKQPDKSAENAKSTQSADASTLAQDAARTQDAQSAQKTAPTEQTKKADTPQQAGQVTNADPAVKMPDVSRTQENQPTPQLAQPDQAQRLENPQQKAITNSAAADWLQTLPSGQGQIPGAQVQTGNQIFLHSSQAAQQAQASTPPQNAWEANKTTAQHMPSITPKLVRTKEAPIEGQRVADYRGDRQPVSGRSQWMILPTRAMG